MSTEKSQDQATTTAGLTFEFTRDADLIHQHFMLYEQENKKIHYPHISEAEYFKAIYPHKPCRNNEHCFVVHDSGQCVGGARIAVSTPEEPAVLPLETDGFRLADHFPELVQQQMSYGQIRRFVLMPEFRTDAIKQQMFLHLRKKVAELEIVFAIGPKANARLYKQICLAMGLDEVKIHYQVELPDYPFIFDQKYYLQSGVLSKAVSTKIFGKSPQTRLAQPE